MPYSLMSRSSGWAHSAASWLRWRFGSWSVPAANRRSAASCAGPIISVWWWWTRFWSVSSFRPRRSVSRSSRRRMHGGFSIRLRSRRGSPSFARSSFSTLRSISSTSSFMPSPALWRLHRMHHADFEFDFTTVLRFHPIEIVLSMVIKLAVVVALGAPAVAVLIFEVVLNATSMFNHGNIRIPLGFDRVLRWFVVTPDMHRVHHSILSRETNSNFGFNLPWWDRLFGTYRAQPAAGHDAMTIGIEQFRDARELGLDRMLLQPFRGDAGRYPLGERQVEQ